MATFRKIHVQFWSDPYIQTLSPEKKYFYLYLLTNEKTKQCGIYEISPRQISHDTGYTVETVLTLLQYFIDSGKIMFSRDTNEVAVKNWNKYNDNASSKVQVLVNKEIREVKNKTLIDYIYSIDTVSIHNPQEEEEIEKEKKNKKKENFPKADDFGDLPIITLEQAIQFISITKRVDVSERDIKGLWSFFKNKNLTGENFYANENKVYSHFLDSLKYQKFEHGTTDKFVIGKDDPSKGGKF